MHLDSMPSYSKAAQGLFVLLWLNGIFTVFAISPGTPSRQSPDRSAIRAGRNLPDKEFRLIIVTMAWFYTLCMSPCSSDYIFSAFQSTD